MALSQQDISAATQAISQHQRILIVPHSNPDPDCLSSALACYKMFTEMGKDVTVICPDTPPESLQFLPGFEKFEGDVEDGSNVVISVNLDDGVEVDKLRYTVEDGKVNIIVVPKKGKIRGSQISFSDSEKKYDLIVAVDTADTALFGKFYTDHIDLFSETPILNVDHHISNTRYGQLHLIDPTAASATEVLYAWFMKVPEWKQKITPDMATLLLAGLITDTRSFQNPNTTPRSLEIAAELLEKGARQQEIIQHIYKTKPLSTLKIWGRALNRIQMDATAGIVWSSISREDLQEMDASSKETHGILDELISTIPNADVHVLFTEVEDPSPGSGQGGGLKASVRSSAAIDVSRLAGETYGGGGHPRAAGFRVKSFDNFQLQVLECVKKLAEGMRRQKDEGQEAGEETKNQPAHRSLGEGGKPVKEERKEKKETKTVQSGASLKDEFGKQKKPETDVSKALTNGGTGGGTDVVGKISQS